MVASVDRATVILTNHSQCWIELMTSRESEAGLEAITGKGRGAEAAQAPYGWSGGELPSGELRRSSCSSCTRNEHELRRIYKVKAVELLLSNVLVH